MEILNTDIAKFKKLYKEKFNIELDDHDARHKLSLLVRQMEIVYQPITKQQLEDFKEARKRDAKALAELTYDVYQDNKHNSPKHLTE
jgi:hypothetical protein